MRERRDHPAWIDDDVLGLASDFVVVSSPAVAVGGLAAAPDERGRDHCRAARGEFTADAFDLVVYAVALSRGSLLPRPRRRQVTGERLRSEGARGRGPAISAHPARRHGTETTPVSPRRAGP